MISSKGIIPTNSLSVLSNKTILITRPVHQAQNLARLLELAGAETLFQPAIEILPPEDWGPLDRVLDRLDHFDYLVFSSVNGVDFFFQRWAETRQKAFAFSEIRFAAIGSSTAEALKAKGVTSVLAPESFRAEELADALVADMNATISNHRPRFLLLRASRGREVLAETLRDANADVEQVVVYQSVDVKQAKPDVLEKLRKGKIDWVLLTSSSIAASTANMLGDDLRSVKIATISPVTSAVVRKLGFEVALEAKEFTMEGIVKALIEETEAKR